MKKYFILPAIIILGISLAAKAQVKQITPNEFYAAGTNAYQLMSERSRRIITKIENLENGAVTESTTKTEERIYPDKYRLLTVERKGKNEGSSEMIRIGSKIYERINDGSWIVSELSSGNGSGSGSGFSTSCMQFTEEESSVDGVLARKLTSLDITKSGKALTFFNYSVWFDQQGLFLRSESMKGLLEPRIETFRAVTTYEYDPKNLKIEAPVK